MVSITAEQCWFTGIWMHLLTKSETCLADMSTISTSTKTSIIIFAMESAGSLAQPSVHATSQSTQHQHCKQEPRFSRSSVCVSLPWCQTMLRGCIWDVFALENAFSDQSVNVTILRTQIFVIVQRVFWTSSTIRSLIKQIPQFFVFAYGSHRLSWARNLGTFLFVLGGNRCTPRVCRVWPLDLVTALAPASKGLSTCGVVEEFVNLTLVRRNLRNCHIFVPGGRIHILTRATGRRCGDPAKHFIFCRRRTTACCWIRPNLLVDFVVFLHSFWHFTIMNPCRAFVHR